MHNEIYIPKHNDFNSPQRINDEKLYFNKNKDHNYQQYLNQLLDPKKIIFNKVIEYAPGQFGIFYND